MKNETRLTTSAAAETTVAALRELNELVTISTSFSFAINEL